MRIPSGRRDDYSPFATGLKNGFGETRILSDVVRDQLKWIYLCNKSCILFTFFGIVEMLIVNVCRLSLAGFVTCVYHVEKRRSLVKKIYEYSDAYYHSPK